MGMTKGDRLPWLTKEASLSQTLAAGTGPRKTWGEPSDDILSKNPVSFLPKLSGLSPGAREGLLSAKNSDFGSKNPVSPLDFPGSCRNPRICGSVVRRNQLWMIHRNRDA
ncbi:hypothetical protein CC2G_007192 [Coprinopsis cinerea AmutBmut pab1-1]|nr:hypothetical protein CC2G_007192 [Coprinopsis cinerea AmutBmut pab1-1]